MQLKKKYNEYRSHKGTTYKEKSITDKSQQADCDIYKCIEKYGIESLMKKTQAKDYLYIDMSSIINPDRNQAMTQLKELNDYFEKLPATVRKAFGDNKDKFRVMFRAGEFDEFISNGILSEDMVKGIEEEKEKYINSIKEKAIQENEIAKKAEEEKQEDKI